MTKNFWDRNARRYNRFMRKDAAAYGQLYALLRPIVNGKHVLELAAGTGLISKNIQDCAADIDVTDASAEMIAEACRDNTAANLHFSVQDMTHLSYPDGCFDVVIAANVLHILPAPEQALREIRRVLKEDGILVAPTFTHGDNTQKGKIKAFFMKLTGFPLRRKWTKEAYLAFLGENGWTVENQATLNASFPMTYAECKKSKQ